MLGFRKSLSAVCRQPMLRSLATAPKEKPFDKILIANRGEIACRVMRTCKRLGVKTVAIYSDVDARSMHVSMADEAFCVGTALSADSYLRMDHILEIAKMTGSQGIHPGYGFLSENAKFADMVEEAGIAFIGPSSRPMNLLGDKINSKKVAAEANCSIIPGFDGEVLDAAHCVKLANEVGYPVMIKASAGGGGKGMRVAYNDAQVVEGFRVCKAEAAASFGDDRMLIERFIENPHHIEIQVVADTHGNVVAFPERECSVQRRNQKVVEESPSCLVDAALRKEMQKEAIALCHAVGYRSAGTIEMLADENRNFYFLEMNTRLQVEHPITELVSGEDLVEHMLWVAAGKKLAPHLLAVKDGCMSPTGWAIESRVYAEDPIRNFLPSIGPLVTYKEPERVNGEGMGGKDGPITVRIDTGVYEGGTISMYYDPMISKLVTHGPTREHAMNAMDRALDNYVVNGLGNNICFLRDVLRNPRFRAGKYGTSFIAEEYPEGFHGVVLNETETKELITMAALVHESHLNLTGDTSKGYGDGSPNSSFEEDQQQSRIDECVVVLGGPKGQAYHVTMDVPTGDDEYGGLEVKIVALEDGKMKAKKGAEKVYLTQFNWSSQGPLASALFSLPPSQRPDGVPPAVEERVIQMEGPGPEGYNLRMNGSQQYVIVRSVREHELSHHMHAPVVKDYSKFLVCPMPGSLVSLDCEAGQTVTEGQALATVEAMKMQNVLRAQKSGVIKSVLVKQGDRLKVDQILVEFEA